VDNFADRHMLVVTAFSVDRILRHLHVRQRFMWAGTGIGSGFMLAGYTTDSFRGGLYLAFSGWFLSIVTAELRFARDGGRIRRPIGVMLAPPLLTLAWRTAAVLASAVALSAVLRSFWQEVGVTERLWAVCTLGVVLAVELLVMGLNRREPAAGPADLVAAEVAIRSNSARTLLAGGTIVALWIAPGSGLPESPYALKVIGWLLAFGLPTPAVVKAMTPWRPTGRSPAAAKAVATSRPVDVLRALRLASGRPWPVLASALLAVGLATVTPYGEVEPPDERRAAAGAFSGPARYASRSSGGCTRTTARRRRTVIPWSRPAPTWAPAGPRPSRSAATASTSSTSTTPPAAWSCWTCPVV
jgi:hypothetical protein